MYHLKGIVHYYTDIADNMLLGLDFMQKQKCIVILKDNTLQLSSSTITWIVINLDGTFGI